MYFYILNWLIKIDFLNIFFYLNLFSYTVARKIVYKKTQIFVFIDFQIIWMINSVQINVTVFGQFFFRRTGPQLCNSI